MTNPVRESWTLDPIFPGGSQSPVFAAFLTNLQAEVTACQAALQQSAGPTRPEEVPAFAAQLARLYQVGLQVMEAESYTTCLTMADLSDEPARLLKSRREQVQAAHGANVARLDAQLLQVPAEVWPQLLTDPQVAPFVFALEQRRRQAGAMLPPEQEAAIKVLAADGHSGWTDVFHIAMGRMRVTVEIDGEQRTLGLGQAGHLASRSPNRALRAEVAAKSRAELEREAPLLASALNHIAGYRVATYQMRGWDSVLREPLAQNLMSEASLAAMWTAVESRREKLLDFLRRKAHLLGLERLAPYDLMAPINAAARRLSYAESVQHVVETLNDFNPAMGAFAQRAVAEGWVDAQESATRQPGINMSLVFPQSGEVRVFLNAKDNPPIVAHELGHAYGDQEILQAPAYAGLLPLSFALLEIPSTFFQLVVARGMIERATSQEERTALLAEQCLQTISLVLSRQSQFLLERAIYEQRKQGPLSEEQFSAALAASYQQVYGDTMGEYNPYAWANNLYLYLPEWPFYNFPYTASYLLSAGLYDRARREGPAFAASYQQVLRDIGGTTVEELAAKHLDADLTQPAFWERALDVLLEDVHEFLDLTKPQA